MSTGYVVFIDDNNTVDPRLGCVRVALPAEGVEGIGAALESPSNAGYCKESSFDFLAGLCDALLGAGVIQHSDIARATAAAMAVKAQARESLVEYDAQGNIVKITDKAVTTRMGEKS